MKKISLILLIVSFAFLANAQSMGSKFEMEKEWRGSQVWRNGNLVYFVNNSDKEITIKSDLGLITVPSKEKTEVFYISEEYDGLRKGLKYTWVTWRKTRKVRREL